MELTASNPRLAAPATASIRNRVLRRLLGAISRGSLSVTLPDGTCLHHVGQEPGPHGQLTLHRWHALARMAWSGDLGFADGRVAGEWSSPDLPRLLALGAVNMAGMDGLLDGAWPVRLLRRLGHWRKANSRAGSQRNISFHYDLGNEFYRLWLDESMAYSSALAFAPGQTLEAAQAARFDRIARLLAPGLGDRVLEIGCGWGGLAMHLARAGADVTGVTLSREQLAWAQDSVARAGLAASIDLRLQDYRDLDGEYDRIVSIEMLEAVGEAWWPAYFAQLRDRLRPGGKALVQVITIAEDRYAHYRETPDFIQQHIFPGGMLPTRTIMADQAAAAGLAITHTELFAAGYAATLAEWRRRFHARWEEIARLGFDDRFRRLWDYYLAYCEAGFATGQTDVGLYLLEHAPAA